MAWQPGLAWQLSPSTGGKSGARRFLSDTRKPEEAKNFLVRCGISLRDTSFAAICFTALPGSHRGCERHGISSNQISVSHSNRYMQNNDHRNRKVRAGRCHPSVRHFTTKKLLTKQSQLVNSFLNAILIATQLEMRTRNFESSPHCRVP